MLDTSTSFAALSALAIGLAVTVHYRYKRIYAYWRDRGIAGPRPYYLFGNVIQLLLNLQNGFSAKCAEKYGRVFGYYEGVEPVLSVADVEIARKICISDFDVFPNHKPNRFISAFFKKFIFSLQDDQWRRVRALMSPTFTSGKMRRMVRLLNKCADDLIETFNEQIAAAQENLVKVNLKNLYSFYTLDAITTCCYALKLEREKNVKDLKTMATRNEFVSDALKLFQFSVIRFLVAVTFNNRLLDIVRFELFPRKNVEPLIEKVSKVIKARRSTDRKFDDYLQLLLDAKLDAQVELDEFDNKENHHAGLSNDSLLNDQRELVSKLKQSGSGKFMSDEEILCNAMFLMVVGFETTGNLLTSCTYAMAFHKDVQDKLREQIRSIAKIDESSGEVEFDYDKITACEYLDAVICETLRLLSPVNQTDRHSNRDYYLEKLNLTLPAGSKIIIQLKDMMRDPAYWEEPNKFNPERFMPGQKEKIVPGAYCPFGLGPRHCIGMRFSLTESKLALAKLILKFEFSPAPKTHFPPAFKISPGLSQLVDPSVLVSQLKVKNG